MSTEIKAREENVIVIKDYFSVNSENFKISDYKNCLLKKLKYLVFLTYYLENIGNYFCFT